MSNVVIFYLIVSLVAALSVMYVMFKNAKDRQAEINHLRDNLTYLKTSAKQFAWSYCYLPDEVEQDLTELLRQCHDSTEDAELEIKDFMDVYDGKKTNEFK